MKLKHEIFLQWNTKFSLQKVLGLVSFGSCPNCMSSANIVAETQCITPCVWCVSLCVWYQIRVLVKNHSVSDPSKMDTLMHKTHSKVLLVLLYQDSTYVDPWYDYVEQHIKCGAIIHSAEAYGLSLQSCVWVFPFCILSRFY